MYACVLLCLCFMLLEYTTTDLSDKRVVCLGSANIIGERYVVGRFGIWLANRGKTVIGERDQPNKNSDFRVDSQLAGAIEASRG